MNQPNPAIVAQSAVRRLPRAALWLFCLAYVLPGFIGRAPWRRDDIVAFAYMLELVEGVSHWLRPTVQGLAPDLPALLPYWLGAAAIQIAPAGFPADLAVRIPFIGLLLLTLSATWYGTYQLARGPDAQPVTFAFGGEASPSDYARALADGALLALIACLGLAQPAHETTPMLAQLCFSALAFYGFSALPDSLWRPLLGASLGLVGLALSGAPSLAVILGFGGFLALLSTPLQNSTGTRKLKHRTLATAGLIGVVALLASLLHLWRWQLVMPPWSVTYWLAQGNLLIWFTWPAWPLALWTLWRWRRQLLRGSQLPSRHLLLPLWFAGAALVAALGTVSPERSLLLALPPLATLAAFALPTLDRTVAALVDWFTLLFFSGCACIVWVVWIAMQTGVPWQPAANVERLAPGFVPSFSWVAFACALAATAAWLWLVKWRVGQHRAAIWKSLVLPAAGAALCWLLLMTLWLPLLDYARSDVALAQRITRELPAGACAHGYQLNGEHSTALRFHGELQLKPLDQAGCQWLITTPEAAAQLGTASGLSVWSHHAQHQHPVERDDKLLIYRRITATAP
jgi:4-amino-4-deoxy-L-arabinose transferase-like glycosyltransferase